MPSPMKNPSHTASRFRPARTPRPARVAALTLLLSLSAHAGAQALPPLPGPAFAPVGDNGRIAAGARGLRAIPGYGMIIGLGERSASLYHYAGRLCWRDPRVADADLVNLFIPYYARSHQPRDFAFAQSPDSTQLHAKPLSQLPPACTAGTDRGTPLYLFDAVSTTLRTYYPFNRERDVDWGKRIARLRPGAAAARSDAELVPIFTELLRGLDDAHTSITGELDGKRFAIENERGYTFARLRQIHAQRAPSELFFEWINGWLDAQRAQADALLVAGSRRSELDGKVVWGRLEGNVGYLSIGQMMGFGEGLSEDRRLIGETIDRALRDLAATDSLVLDIAHNTGGSDEVSSDIAARFADRTRLAYTKHAHGADSVQPQPFFVGPRGQSRYRKPVYLLTSELTASAAEVFGLMMRTLPNVTQVGQPSLGVFSDALFKVLPNGWYLSLTNEVYRDARGQVHEGPGLPPDVAIAVYSANDFETGYPKALRRVARLAAQHGH